MFKVGLTGGIGSGKTRVAEWLAQWGAAVVDSDELAHALTAPGGLAMGAIATAFGSNAVAADGSLNRPWMRERVFADSGERRRLEAILHPLIAKAAALEADRRAGLYQVFVVPLLVESGRWRERVDRIAVVDCDAETQIARVQTRSGLTIELIQRIMATQVDRNARLALADDVILNDGSVSQDQLHSRVRAVHDRWCEMAYPQG